jgi:hypothetical protein
MVVKRTRPLVEAASMPRVSKTEKLKVQMMAEFVAECAPIFLEIERHPVNRPPGVAKDDLLDAAAAA